MLLNSWNIENKRDIKAVTGRIRRASFAKADVFSTVSSIVEEVRLRGDDALVELTERFDGARLETGEIEVSTSRREEAWELLDTDLRAALELAAERISSFAKFGSACDAEFEVGPGVRVGRLSRPLDSAGLYIPGGRFPYPSTVLMTGIPAREAGVREISFCVPPGKDGSINPVTLAATNLVGECRVFKVGGAQAVAAMAYGTGIIPRCRVIAGPGNVYVTVAKRLLSHLVTIDLEAGPSEVAILADASTDVSFATADILAQLEHDPISLAVLVSESERVLEEAGKALERMSWGEGPSGAANLVLSSSPELSLEFLNELAPEHLELMVKGAEGLTGEIRNAGCLFVGPFSPVAIGDYVSGPSHVLPTGGTASRLSGLSVGTFTRTMNLISYTREGFERDSEVARLLAVTEGLDKHAASIDIRRRLDA